MWQVKVSTVISAPREEVFDFVADMSTRPAFTDHYLKDFRLARANPHGAGAAGRFLLDGPVFNERAEISIAECDRPQRIVEEGRLGRRGRSRIGATYEFVTEDDGGTRVELTSLSEPKTSIDRLRQLGARPWLRRQTNTALDRLRRIFEDPPDGGLDRVTTAAHEPHRAPRFGGHVEVPRRTGAGDG